MEKIRINFDLKNISSNQFTERKNDFTEFFSKSLSFYQIDGNTDNASTTLSLNVMVKIIFT